MNTLWVLLVLSWPISGEGLVMGYTKLYTIEQECQSTALDIMMSGVASGSRYDTYLIVATCLPKVP
jgi:hypothetical protein